MKVLKFIFLAIIITAFSSCFDVIETFTFNEDGTGVYEQKMDMGRFFTTMSEMGGGAKRKKEKKDTAIYYKDMVDTVSSLTTEEKNIFRNAYAKMHLDEENNEGQIVAYYHFKNEHEFEIIQNVLSRKDGNNNLIDVLGNAVFKKEKMNLPPTSSTETEEDKVGAIFLQYQYFLTKNSFGRKALPKTKKANDATVKEKTNDIPEELKEMMKVNFKTIINLPKPISKVVGDNAEISSDKKKITFSKEMDFEAFDNLEGLNFLIDF